MKPSSPTRRSSDFEDGCAVGSQLMQELGCKTQAKINHQRRYGYRGQGPGQLHGRSPVAVVMQRSAHGQGRRQRARSANHGKGQRVKSLGTRSEEHTSELQSLMRTSYAVFCLKKQK